jgi:heme-degrading monooxygenase HmoA
MTPPAAIPPNDPPAYRVLTGPDDAAFCRRVSEALALGYRLHGSPALAFNGSQVIVAQALAWPGDARGAILESAPLQVRAGESKAFEAAFREAQAIIASMPGYRSHELQRCIERAGHYLLLVRWDSVADHEEGFRKSPQYARWKALLHHFYEPFPTVLHYEPVGAAP